MSKKISMVIAGHPPMLHTKLDNTTLEWSTRIWNKIRDSKTESVFGYVNLYWDNQSEEFNKELFSLFQQANELIATVDPSDDYLKLNLSPICNRILDMHPIEAMRKHIDDLPATYTPYIDPKTMKDDLGDNVEAQTYTKQDYYDLVAFATVIKTLTPIIGSYANLIKDLVGTNHKEKAVYDLISNNPIFLTPAGLKLQAYIDAWLTNLTSKSKASIEDGIAPMDLPYHYMAYNLVNIFPRQCFREYNGKIEPSIIPSQILIIQIYNFISGKSRKHMKGPKEKKIAVNGEDSQESDSYADYYRTQQDLPDYLITLNEAYVADIELFASHALDNDPELIQMAVEMRDRLDQAKIFSSCKLHEPVFIKTLKGVVDGSLVNKFSRIGLISCCAVAYVKLQTLGFKDIAEIIVAIRGDEDISQISLSGIYMEDLDRSLKQDLTALTPYLYQKSKSNKTIPYAFTFITETVQMVNRYNLGLDPDLLKYLRISLAEFLLDRTSSKFPLLVTKQQESKSE